MSNEPKARISRRTFVTGTVAGLAVGAALGVAGGYLGAPTKTQSETSTQTTTLPASTTTAVTTATTTLTQSPSTVTSTQVVTSATQAGLPATWDQTTDVVVIGSGGAGLAAAVGAIESGAQVIILEKSHAVGGTTGVSGGGMWIPNNSLAVKAGVTQPLSEVLTYLNGIGEGQQNPSLINTYLQQGPTWIDHYMQITGTTLSINTTFNDYYNVAGEVPSPGAGFQVSPSNGGAGIIQALQTWINNKGVQVTTSTPAVALYKDGTGRIVGVQASSNGKTVNIAATKGVILAAGGFDNNPAMMAAYLRGPTTLTSAASTNTGDCILMAQAAGAQIANMNNDWGCPHYQTPTGGEADWVLIRGKPGAIIVNSAGKRFANESSAYPVINRTFYAWSSGTYGYANIPAYTIVDQTCVNKYGFVTYIPGSKQPAYVSSANTLQDLATALNIDPTGLQATVTQFNQYAANGVDPDFNRGVGIFDLQTAGDPSRTDLKNICLGPIQTPPYYGLEILPGTIGTCGGPVINSSGQVLTQAGSPIPGLYGAGNDVASPFGAAYPNGGATVGFATVFGWIAGTTAGSS
ncbi:MAG: FAD-dependent oxidoreductase [Nitrososphaerales archaeon]